MSYYESRNNPTESPRFPGLRDTWDAIMDTLAAPFAGLWHGISRKNLTYEQWIRERDRKKGRRPRSRGQVALAGGENWLKRVAGK